MLVEPRRNLHAGHDIGEQPDLIDDPVRRRTIELLDNQVVKLRIRQVIDHRRHRLPELQHELVWIPE
ncbi:TPA: hypothetical protein RZC61_005708, partial [Burkholderia multivorans]|nr:hypothetical protein [Burkholderia multivorans]HEB3546716.1 hypothetical protein [Burkholderia multivorans]HEB3572021.1 hypothetical protein [Burkholderia multivorans]